MSFKMREELFLLTNTGYQGLKGIYLQSAVDKDSETDFFKKMCFLFFLKFYCKNLQIGREQGSEKEK